MVQLLLPRRNIAQELLREERGAKALVGLLRDEERREIEFRQHHHKKWPDYGRLNRGDHWPLAPIGTNAQVTINIVSKLIRVLVSLITGGNIRFECMARIPEAEGASRANDAVLQVIQERNRIQTVQDQCLTDACTYGGGATYTWWDPDAMDGAGDVRIDWLDIYRLFMDKNANGLHNAQVVSVRKAYPLAIARAMWPEFADQLKSEFMPPGQTDMSGLYRPFEDVPNSKPWQRMVGLSGADSSGGGSFTSYVGPGSDNALTTSGLDDEVYVWEHYVRCLYADAVYDPRVLAAIGEDQRLEAKDENARLAAGQWVDPTPGDDLATHFSEHKKELLRGIGQDSEERNQFLAEHLARTKEMMDSPEYRKMKRSQYPGGFRMIQRCGDVILNPKPEQQRMPTGRLPIGYMKNYEDPGHWVGIGEGADAESMQYAANVILSQCVDLVRFAAHRPCVVDASSDIKDEQLISQVGIILRAVRQPGVPAIEWPDGPQLDPSWLNLLAFLVNGIQEQAGLPKVMEGQLPGSGLSGEALETLRKGGQVRVAMRANNFQGLMIETGEAVLAHVYRYMTEPQTLKVQGNPARMPQGAVPAQDGTGASFVPVNSPDGTNQLQGFEPSKFNIYVNAAASPAQGKMQRRDEIMFLVKSQMISPPLGRELLVPIGVLNPRDLQRQQELEQQQQAQHGPPPPSVNVSLRGEIPPQEAMALAAGQPPPPPQQMMGMGQAPPGMPPGGPASGPPQGMPPEQPQGGPPGAPPPQGMPPGMPPEALIRMLSQAPGRPESPTGPPQMPQGPQ